MNPGRDAFIIVLLIIGLGVIVTIGGSLPNNVSRFNDSFVNIEPNTPRDESFVTKEPELTPTQQQQQDTRDIERQIEEAEREVARLEVALAEVEQFGERSPYADKVIIRNSLIGVRAKDVDREQITLEARTTNTEKINISSWKLESTVTNRSVTIGKGVRLYFSGTDNAEESITLAAGEEAIITTGRSPIGESFFINKCSGYFEQFQSFVPAIQKKCPTAEEEIQSYTRDTSIFTNDACLDFVERIPRCSVQTKPLPLTLTFACQDAIINEINYSSCIDEHKGNPDFYQGEWRIFLGRDQELWKDKREVIRLLDENGKTVDYITY